MDRQKESQADDSAAAATAAVNGHALPAVTSASSDGSSSSTHNTATTTNGAVGAAGVGVGAAHAATATDGDGAAGSPAGAAGGSTGTVSVQYGCPAEGAELVTLQGLTVCTPDRANTLVRELSIKVLPRQSLLIMGPSVSAGARAGMGCLYKAKAAWWVQLTGVGTRGTLGVMCPCCMWFKGCLAVDRVP